MISLPRKWAKKYGLKKGDEVELSERGKELLLSTEKAIEEEATTTVKIEDAAKFMGRLVHAPYRFGYNEVEIKYSDPSAVPKIQEYLDQLQKALLQQKYVMQKKKAAFDGVGQPSEAEIVDFYESNKTAFVVPDMVRFKHVFIDTRNLEAKTEKEKARERAEQIALELRNGSPFDDLVVKYSDDKASRYKGGDFGYLRRDDQGRKQLLGKDFFEAPFKMKVGESSGVLSSSIGLHIIKITEKIPFRLLGLEDPIPPQNTGTVRQEINAQLTMRKQADVYQQALTDLLNELKKKAEIKKFEDNLTW